MAKNEINEQLLNLIKSLLSFIAIVWKLYKPYLKGVIVAGIAYVAFKIGRITIIDPLEQSVTKLQSILERRADFTIYLPEKIKKVQRIKTILFFLVILSASIWILAYSFKIRIIRKGKVKYMLIYMVTVIISLFMVWAYEWILKMQVKKGRSQDITINQRLYGLQKVLGPRVQGILKIFLCKDQLVKRSSSPRGKCVKNNCKNYRQLLTQRVDSIELLVNSAWTFSWCNICKRKMPFNEFLQFQYHPFVNSGMQEQEQIIQKSNYLIEELLRMIIWAKDTSPCNCSQIYWRESLKNIKQYKRKQKEIDKRMLIYQSRQVFKY